MKRIHVFAGCRPAVIHTAPMFCADPHQRSGHARMRARSRAGAPGPGRTRDLGVDDDAPVTRGVCQSRQERLDRVHGRARTRVRTDDGVLCRPRLRATTRSVSMPMVPVCPTARQRPTGAVDGLGVDAARLALGSFHKRLKLRRRGAPWRRWIVSGPQRPTCSLFNPNRTRWARCVFSRYSQTAKKLMLSSDGVRPKLKSASVRSSSGCIRGLAGVARA